MPSVADNPPEASTPRSFTNQTASAEDLLKSQTVGLVNLSDFRKRRAEVLEQKEKEAQDRTYGRLQSTDSGGTTPLPAQDHDHGHTLSAESVKQPPRKKKKAARTILSFQEDDAEDSSTVATPLSSRSNDSKTSTPAPDDRNADPVSRRITPNPHLSAPAPKVATKSSLQAEALARDQLRREFLSLQEAVKATEVSIPFVFYDGTNIPGGQVRMKKGDPMWLFLDRCRKVGAELGVSGGSGYGGSTKKNDSRREWARVSVDDLMMVRGDVIIPHHYELYYFIANRVVNPLQGGSLLFDYSNTAPKQDNPAGMSLIKTFNDNLEGRDADPVLTKVVDRRWYERNKHIFPANMWKEYESGKDFESQMASGRRRDTEGNLFFF